MHRIIAWGGGRFKASSENRAESTCPNQISLYSRAMSTRSGDVWRGVLAVAALLCVGLLIAGCGGGSSTTGSSSTASEEASAAFIKKGHVNKLPKFGEEASEEEREEVNVIVVENLKARAAADFVTQCETLNMKGIKEVPKAKNHQDCAAALKKFAEPFKETEKAREDTLKGSISVLRVKGDKAWLFTTETDGKDYAVPLEKEDGHWRISSIFTEPL